MVSSLGELFHNRWPQDKAQIAEPGAEMGNYCLLGVDLPPFPSTQTLLPSLKLNIRTLIDFRNHRILTISKLNNFAGTLKGNETLAPDSEVPITNNFACL